MDVGQLEAEKKKRGFYSFTCRKSRYSGELNEDIATWTLVTAMLIVSIPEVHRSVADIGSVLECQEHLLETTCEM